MAAAITRGRPFAGAPTVGGAVLLVVDDDPRGWRGLLTRFDADLHQVFVRPARSVLQPDTLDAQAQECMANTIIVDSLTTWCRAGGWRIDDTTDAAYALGNLADAARRRPGRGVIVTHHEARDQGSPGGYTGRARNSSAIEDAVDFIRRVRRVREGVTRIEPSANPKARYGIPTEAVEIDLDADDFGPPPRDFSPPARANVLPMGDREEGG